MDSPPRSPLAPPRSDVVTFCIILHSNNDVSARALSLSALPDTVAELQAHVETEFHVPRCCQTISLESVPLQGTDSLSSHRIRNGDTFHVRYKSEADVKDLREVLGSMQRMIRTIESEYHQNKYYSEGLFDAVALSRLCRIQPERVECLASNYFWPCSSDRAIANRLFFLDQQGLQLLYKLHSLVLTYQWQETPVSLQQLEQGILRVLWNITASFDVRTRILEYPFLELCMKSAQRIRIEYNERVRAPKHLACITPTPLTEQNYILGEVIYKACGTLCK